MDDEEDPLAQIIAMLREATRAAGAAAKATHEGMRQATTDAAATGSAGRGGFAAWRHSRSGKCSAGGETALLKAFFLSWLPPRRRGGCVRAVPGLWPDRFWGRVAGRKRQPRIEETLD